MAYDFIRALLYDGVNDDVSFTEIAYSICTVNIWVNLSDFDAAANLIHRSAGSTRFFNITSSTQIGCRLTGTFTDFTVPEMSVNTWHMLSWKVNNGDVRVYLDAVESSTGEVDIGSGNLLFSKINNSVANGFPGIVDDFIVWSSVLSDANITSLYNSGCGVDPTTVVASPVRYYDCNGSGTDTTLTDSGSDGADGTLNNFPSSGMWVNHLGCPDSRIIQLNQAVHRANSY